MQRTLVVVVVALGVLAALPATASTGQTGDANDSAGPLDIESVSHGHGSTPRRLVHTIRMYEGWDSTLLAGPESWIGIHIQSDPDRFVHSDDRFIWVKATGSGELSATMHEMGNHGNGPVV